MAVLNTASDIQNHQRSGLRHESVLYMTIAYDYLCLLYNTAKRGELRYPFRSAWIKRGT